MEFTYEGKVHGRPAMKRAQHYLVEKTPDGKLWGTGEQVVENTDFVERANFNPAEYTFDHYKVNEKERQTPYLAYYALALTAATAIGWVYLIVAWKRGWRYRRSAAPVGAAWSADQQNP